MPVTLDEVVARRWLLANTADDASPLNTTAAGLPLTPAALVRSAQDPMPGDGTGLIDGLRGRQIELLPLTGPRGHHQVAVHLPARHPGGDRLTLLDSRPIDVPTHDDGWHVEVDAGLALLAAIVTAVNRVCDQLDEHTRSYVLVVRDPDQFNLYLQDGNVDIVDIDLGYDWVRTPDTEDQAIAFLNGMQQLQRIPANSPVLIQALETYATVVRDYPAAAAMVRDYRNARQLAAPPHGDHTTASSTAGVSGENPDPGNDAPH